MKRNKIDLDAALHEMLEQLEFSAYLNQWVNYPENNQNRLKMTHDLTLKDGTILERYRPNACAWFKMFKGPGPERVEDNDVAFIRLSLNQGWR